MSDNTGATGVTVYSDAKFAGQSAELAVGRFALNPDLDNTISSVRVPAGYTVTLYDGPDFTGQKLTLTSDTTQLDSGFNDKTSSIVVTSTAAQAQATGTGASNPNNTAAVDGSDYTAIHQENVSVTFAELW
ncbi:hypothetical protein A8W25_24825 [Streptomyces sp. ERV7]|uniref:peptidase inhibitor family I36 protein n=1 Tax=Streptomyces sp. ERV7 TaxID=1322334 RepID=UPI0007F4985E|nr:peptidase inhibitor family I36 protein [Streptomyces sp. ERV7]OAR22800.1 hypothetical protein A8W25_24825 [Streptomyces sp. ERV7]